MSMAIVVYEYGREGKCVYMFRHTYTGIRERKMKVGRVYSYLRGYVYINRHRDIGVY